MADVIPALDNADAERLLVAMHARPGCDTAALAGTVAMRVRYLQKREFPSYARAGRGRRTRHDVDGALRLVTAFELLAAGIAPARTAVTVEGNWWILSRVLVASWRAARMMAGGDADPAAQAAAGRLRRIVLLDPLELHGDEAPVPVQIARPDDDLWRAAEPDGLERCFLVLEPLRVVTRFMAAMRDELRYRDPELDLGFRAMGAAAFGTSDEAVWGVEDHADAA